MFPDGFRIVSTSALVQRLSVDQTAIEARLLELEGIEEIRNGLKNANINSDETMHVDVQPEPRVIDAKRRALSRYVCPHDSWHNLIFSDSCSVMSGSASIQQCEPPGWIPQSARGSGAGTACTCHRLGEATALR